MEAVALKKPTCEVWVQIGRIKSSCIQERLWYTNGQGRINLVWIINHMEMLY